MFRPSSYNDAVSVLRSAKITGIAHHAWTAGNATEADVILLEFANDSDASGAADSLATMNQRFFGAKSIAVPGIPARFDTRAVYQPESTDGLVHTAVMTHVKRIVVFAVTYSPVHADVPSTASWVARQLSVLPGAGKLTPLPAAAAPPANASRLRLPLSAKLQARLVPAPADSAPVQNAWARDISPTVADFVLALYPNDSRTTSGQSALLIAEGINGIVHRTWKTSGGESIDVRLLQFSSAGGATSRYQLAVRGEQTNNTAVQFAVPSAYDVEGFVTQDPNMAGSHVVLAYGWKGTVEFEVDINSTNTDQTLARALVTAQTARLPG